MRYQENLNKHAKGEYSFFNLQPWVTEKDVAVEKLREFVRTGHRAILDQLKKGGVLLDFAHKENLLPTAGRTVIARRAAGDITYTGEIDWGALGSGNTAFNSASTHLTTEVFRKQAASQAWDNNVAYIDWFIAAGDVANQTFQEFGAFMDGTAAANSGQAFSLLVTGGWVKSGSIFISGKYTF